MWDFSSTTMDEGRRSFSSVSSRFRSLKMWCFPSVEYPTRSSVHACHQLKKGVFSCTRCHREKKENGKKSQSFPRCTHVCRREMQRGCWCALIVFEFSVRCLSNGYLLLDSCLASGWGASLLTEVHFFCLRPITTSHIVAHAAHQKATGESLPSFMSRWVSYSSTQMLALRSFRDTVCGPDGVTFVCRMDGSHLFKQSSIIYPWNCEMFSIIWLHDRSSLLCINASSFCTRSDLEVVSVFCTRLDKTLQICTTLRVKCALFLADVSSFSSLPLWDPPSGFVVMPTACSTGVERWWYLFGSVFGTAEDPRSLENTHTRRPHTRNQKTSETAKKSTAERELDHRCLHVHEFNPKTISVSTMSSYLNWGFQKQLLCEKVCGEIWECLFPLLPHSLFLSFASHFDVCVLNKARSKDHGRHIQAFTFSVLAIEMDSKHLCTC